MHVIDGYTVSCKCIQVRRDRHQGQTGDLLKFHVGRSLDPTGNVLHLTTDGCQLFQVVAVQLDGNLSPNAGNELVHPHLHGLSELVVVARNGANHLLELGNKLRLRLARIRPFVPIFEHDEGVGYGGGMGSVATSAVPILATTSSTSGNCLIAASS